MARPLNLDLIEAAKTGDTHKIEQLLQQGAVADSSDEKNWTALGWAAMRGHARVVQLLISAGADPNRIADPAGTTPLAAASFAGQDAVVELLLVHGARPNTRTTRGSTPLTAASAHGDLTIVRQLVEHGADVNARGPGGGSPLLLAIQEGHLEIAKYLLNHKADPNLQSDSGLTPLMQAAGGGDYGAVKLLLDHGAVADVQDKYGRTARDTVGGAALLQPEKKGVFEKIGELLAKCEKLPSTPQDRVDRLLGGLVKKALENRGVDSSTAKVAKRWWQFWR
jgi:ankyrin repeat protein